MKTFITLLSVLGLAGILTQSLAQNGGNGGTDGQGGSGGGTPPGPQDDPSYYNWNYSWSNYFNYGGDFAYGSNSWWTHTKQMEKGEAPKKYQHQNQGVICPNERPEDHPIRLRDCDPQGDVQAMVQQFQQDRTQLMQQLKTCSDEQRQQILQQMEQIRIQLRERLREQVEQARQQAEQQKNRLQNTLGQLNGNPSGGTGNRGRN